MGHHHHHINVFWYPRDDCGIAGTPINVARSRGMTEIARKTGPGRQALYKSLSEEGNPMLETLVAVLSALGLELTVQKRAAQEPR